MDKIGNEPTRKRSSSLPRDIGTGNELKIACVIPKKKEIQRPHSSAALTEREDKKMSAGTTPTVPKLDASPKGNVTNATGSDIPSAPMQLEVLEPLPSKNKPASASKRMAEEEPPGTPKKARETMVNVSDKQAPSISSPTKKQPSSPVSSVPMQAELLKPAPSEQKPVSFATKTKFENETTPKKTQKISDGSDEQAPPTSTPAKQQQSSPAPKLSSSRQASTVKRDVSPDVFDYEEMPTSRVVAERQVQPQEKIWVSQAEWNSLSLGINKNLEDFFRSLCDRACQPQSFVTYEQLKNVLLGQKVIPTGMTTEGVLDLAKAKGQKAKTQKK